MERIGFVGLGTMGAAMAGHLARSGHPLTVWNRTPGRAAELVAARRRRGARSRPPRRGERRHRRLRLGYAATSRRSCSDRTAWPPAARTGSLVIDCSTIAPAATRDFAARLAERGIDLVDAPVSGGSEGAQKATLTIFVGGEPAAVERARPILAAPRHDDHPRRARGCRPGGQGGQPGDPGRDLPRRRRGDRPRPEGRARRRAGRRGARRAAPPRAGSSPTAAGG